MTQSNVRATWRYGVGDPCAQQASIAGSYVQMLDMTDTAGRAGCVSRSLRVTCIVELSDLRFRSGTSHANLVGLVGGFEGFASETLDDSVEVVA